jgi:endonuclease-3
LADPAAASRQVEESAAERAVRAHEIAALLHQSYGPRPWRRHLPPVDELVATILSQHTSDINTDRAFASLKARFPTWPEVIAAPTGEVVEAIRSGGLANQKGPRIQQVLASILAEYGTFDLDSLADLPVREARARLTAINGVGPKTASCVLLFSLGMPALPVDTHVHRVTRRLGLIDDKLSADRAHEELESLLQGDRDQTYAFHMHLIGHGRTVCTARRPYCDRCALASRCDYVQFN